MRSCYLAWFGFGSVGRSPEREEAQLHFCERGFLIDLVATADCTEPLELG